MLKNHFLLIQQSLPPRGGWIEITYIRVDMDEMERPSPHGEGGLKLHAPAHRQGPGRPSPHGEGGLK